MSSKNKRKRKAPPLGIQILSVLAVLAGILFLLIGGLGILSVEAATIGVVSILLSIGYILYGLGLWRMETWAWYLAAALHAFGILMCFFTLDTLLTDWINVASLLLDIVIIYYLYTKRKLFDIKVDF